MLKGRRSVTSDGWMLRRLYAWILALSDRPSAPYVLGAVAFADVGQVGQTSAPFTGTLFTGAGGRNSTWN